MMSITIIIRTILSKEQPLLHHNLQPCRTLHRSSWESPRLLWCLPHLYLPQYPQILPRRPWSTVSAGTHSCLSIHWISPSKGPTLVMDLSSQRCKPSDSRGSMYRGSVSRALPAMGQARHVITDMGMVLQKSRRIMN